MNEMYGVDRGEWATRVKKLELARGKTWDIMWTCG